MASSNLPPITQDEFKRFHNIDRKLFTRLVLSLFLEIGQSMQVMAFFLWIEQEGFATDLILQMNSFPDDILSLLVDEVVLCLKCIESLAFDPMLEQYARGFPLIEKVTKKVVSINYLRQNRIQIINDVTRNVNDVCVRAFDDIVNQVQSSRQQSSSLNQVPYPQTASSGDRGHAVYYDASALGAYAGSLVLPNFQQYVAGTSMPPMDPNTFYNNIAIQTHMTEPSVAPIDRNIIYNNIEVQTRSVEDDIIEALGLFNIRTHDDHHRDQDRTAVEEDHEVVQLQPADDRTIFLTFSKGYPISENEVRDFFAGMIGDCIESIYMQEVPEGEQPLYAKLVVPSETVIEAVLDGRPKAKFSINGKHVWARKYVAKNTTSGTNSPPPPRSSSDFYV